MKNRVLKRLLYVLILALGITGMRENFQSSPRIILEDEDKGTVARFSLDGKYILSGGKKNTLKLWDVASGKLVRQFVCGSEKETQDIRAVGFSQDGKHVFACGQDRDLVMWNTETGIKVRDFPGKGNWVEEFAIAPDGLHILTMDENHFLRLWELQTGKMLKEAMRLGAEYILTIEFNKKGTHFLVRELGNTSIWQFSKFEKIIHPWLTLRFRYS